MIEEIWKDVKGFDNIYQASNLGRIRSKERIVNSCYDSTQTKKEKILKPKISRGGYFTLCLYNNTKKQYQYIHRIIAISFLENYDSKPCVNHKDGNKLNNHASNLEWVTSSENTIHAIQSGLLKPRCSSGENNPTSIKIIAINIDSREEIIYGGIRDAERKTGINASSIAAVCKGKRKRAGNFVWKFYSSINANSASVG